MKLKIIVTGLVFILLNHLSGYSNGPPSGYANNAPSFNNCTTCHSGSINSGDGEIYYTGLPDYYTPGQSYTINLTVTGTNSRGYGFQAASQIGNQQAGVFNLNSSSTNLEINGDYVQQSSRLQSGTWVFDWTAPTGVSESITFSASGLATGGSTGTGGDKVYTTEIVVPSQSVAVDNISADPNLEIRGTYPNPFNSKVSINFGISEDQIVIVIIYNLNGMVVRKLLDGRLQKGNHTINWDAMDNKGQQISSGIYYYSIEAKGEKRVQTLTYIK